MGVVMVTFTRLCPSHRIRENGIAGQKSKIGVGMAGLVPAIEPLASKA
jgi:hypothetical protein